MDITPTTTPHTPKYPQKQTENDERPSLEELLNKTERTMMEKIKQNGLCSITMQLMGGVASPESEEYIRVAERAEKRYRKYLKVAQLMKQYGVDFPDACMLK